MPQLRREELNRFGRDGCLDRLTINTGEIVAE
jgi:hypothetical protein